MHGTPQLAFHFRGKHSDQPMPEYLQRYAARMAPPIGGGQSSALPSRPQVVPTGEITPFTCGRCGQVVHAWMISRGLPLAVSYCEKCLTEDEFESMDDWIGAVAEGASHPGPTTTPSDPKDLRIKLPLSKKSLWDTRIKLRRR